MSFYVIQFYHRAATAGDLYRWLSPISRPRFSFRSPSCCLVAYRSALQSIASNIIQHHAASPATPIIRVTLSDAITAVAATIYPTHWQTAGGHAGSGSQAPQCAHHWRAWYP